MGFSTQSNLLLFQRRFPHFRFPNLIFNSFSSLPLPQPPLSSSPSPSPPKPTSLSSRMSFVFDQIDSINRDRGDKDQTLQRIRAWRESKLLNNNPDKPVSDSTTKVEENGDVGTQKDLILAGDEGKGVVKKEENENELILTHPWPEWMEFIQRLVQQNYFDHKRRDEEGLLEDSGFNLGEREREGEEEGKGEEQLRKTDFVKNFRTVEIAAMNFGLERFDILRSLSRNDLQILVGYGCPGTDRKTTFAGKLLRKYVHLDEGDVCSSCSMRSSCRVAYLMVEKEQQARTVDVMRILLNYGFDPINGCVMNRSLLKSKSVKTVVRKLLHEVVKLSAVPIDPNLSPPVIKKPPPKVKQPTPPPRKRVGRDDIEMKKGDWLCAKCDFLNFAKNTTCLQCDAKRPKRQLLPGEWECPQCNFLNYRRNVVCFHCECKRPHDDYMESHIQEKQDGSRPRTGKVLSREEVSNAWNFNFDDDESDGADVAAFEYADSNKLNQDYQGGYDKTGQTRMYDRNKSPPIPINPGAGFNDFSDDDEVDNYEIDNRNEAERAPLVDFAELQAGSESESENGDSSRHASRRTSLNNRKKPARPGNPTFARSKDAELDFGSDDDLPVHPNWKSSHVAKPRQNTRHGGASSFGSDDDLGSDDEGIGGGFSSSRRVQGRQGGNRNRSSSDFESDDDQDFNRAKRTGAGSRSGSSRGGGALRGGRGQFSGTDYPKYSRNERDSGKSAFDGQRSNDRRGNSQSFGRGKGKSHNERGRSSFDGKGSNDRRGGRSAEPDSYYDSERFKKPRNNVR